MPVSPSSEHHLPKPAPAPLRPPHRPYCFLSFPWQVVAQSHKRLYGEGSDYDSLLVDTGERHVRGLLSLCDVTQRSVRAKESRQGWDHGACQCTESVQDPAARISACSMTARCLVASGDGPGLSNMTARPLALSRAFTWPSP